jgi:hypothetical protein
MTRLCYSCCLIFSLSCFYGQNHIVFDSMTINERFSNEQKYLYKTEVDKSYIDDLKSDSTRKSKNEKTTHGLSLELLGPAYLSSIGYCFENQIQEKLAIQFDFRLSGQIEFISSGWDLGPSINQSLLLFNINPRMKLGLTEGIVFNIPSIRGDFDQRMPWDRPPRIMFYFSTNIGCEFKIFRDFLFLTPEVNFFNLHAIKDGVNSNLDEISVRQSVFFISFGLDLKFKL